MEIPKDSRNKEFSLTSVSIFLWLPEILTDNWIKITATAIVDIATKRAVGVRRNVFANGVTKKTNGEAKIPKRQTDIQPIVYLKLKARLRESLQIYAAKQRATKATSNVNTARSVTEQIYLLLSVTESADEL